MADLRDMLVKQYFEEGHSYRLILCFLANDGIIISLRTLKRVLKRLNLRRRGQSDLVHAGRCILAELEQSGSLLGYRAMQLRLRTKYKVFISREVVRGILLAVDPAAVQLRKQHKLIRRSYRSKGPNFCWHMDGYDKLKTFGFAIHGCIDGFSRKVLWIEVSTTNNDSAVVAGYFLKAVQIHGGCPRLLRSDRGTENARVSYIQPFLRRHGMDSVAGDKSFQYGKSVSNQRIESWWALLRKWCTDWWIEFFKMLKDEGHFDETNPVHLDCIRFCFMELLQKELDDVAHMWNTHVMRCSGAHGVGGSPDELFYLARAQGFDDYICEPNSHDLVYALQYVKPKPLPVPQEFTTLAEILFEENNFSVPESSLEAFELYLDMLDEIDF